MSLFTPRRRSRLLLIGTGLLVTVALLVGYARWTSAPSEVPAGPSPVEPPAESPVAVIAFGSCNKQYEEQPLWAPIRSHTPDVWIWLGDNVYADTEDMSDLRADYEQQRAHPGYAALRAEAEVIGTWDDHDYGTNDGDRTYPKRDSSQQIFLDFLDVSPQDPRRQREGVYSTHSYGPPDQRVKVILLDTRYHRDTLQYLGDPDRLYAPRPGGDLLGEAQWAWLERELRDTAAQVHVIGTSIQAVGAEHRWEKWADFPDARQRLFDVIRESNAPGVVLISGDRHRGELSRHDDAIGYPLYELTSSGLTHYSPSPGERNRHRVGELIQALHFGILTFDFDAPDPTIGLQLRGLGDTLLLDHSVPLSTLQPGGDGQM